MPRRLLEILARGYYVVAGLIFGVAAVSSIWGMVWAAQGGCRLVLESLGSAPSTGNPGCQHYVDVLAIVLALAAGVVLVAAAIRFGHADAWSRRLVGLGALVAIAVGVYSMAGVWASPSYGNGPDVLGIAIAALPLLAGLGPAWVTWRVYSERRPGAQQSVA
jgi:hypothetical protein